PRAVAEGTVADPASGADAGRAGAGARRDLRARLRPGASGRLDVERSGGAHGARRRRGGRGPRHAAAAGRGMRDDLADDLDADLAEAAAAPGEPTPGLRRARA